MRDGEWPKKGQNHLASYIDEVSINDKTREGEDGDSPTGLFPQKVKRDDVISNTFKV